MTTFRSWLLGQKHRDDPIGDLARELSRDRCGARLTSPITVIAHMKAHGADEDVLAIAHRAHEQWLKVSAL